MKTWLSTTSAIIFFAVSSAALADSPLIYSPDQVVFGNKMNEWSAEWWQDILSIPSSDSPLLHPTDKCMVSQRGPVWFLVGSASSPATCKIPQGTALFFPIINFIDVNTAKQTVSDLRAEIAACMNGATDLSLTVDGQSVAITTRQHVLSVPFAITLPADNLFELTQGIYSPAVDDGYYVMLRPLAAGPHTITFTGTTSTWPALDMPFSVNITYNLTIVPINLN